MTLQTQLGRPYPFGATVRDGGVNFAVFSRNGTQVYLELFDGPNDHKPSASIALDPRRNRTGDVWHVFVPGLGHGQIYGYRVDGPYDPERGHRFNVNKLLYDPYARSVIGAYDVEHDALYGYDRGADDADLSFSTLDSAGHTSKSVVLQPSDFDWADDIAPRTPLESSVFYEMHVGGFTKHGSSGVTHPGSYLGMIEKIPHLLELGVTAIELLPVHEFNDHEPVGVDPVTGETLENYWGYQTLCFFAPEQAYAVLSSDGTHAPGAEVAEFKRMVRAMHDAGIEVILDVVFNHTGEGDQRGPTLSFRGLDNAVYYMLERGRYYKNYSGCGNTMNCNHPLVKQLIIDSLRYWVVEMHVDGFRFDLATILGRGGRGQWLEELGLLYDIGGDPILRGCKLIAESWDAEGMYKVGGFPDVWAEWNGRFRDDVRRFVRGDRGVTADLARRIGGSRDLFGRKASPAHSINFVTCHDGFSLRDLVSYSHKHNQRNGEENRDGANDNNSANWGVEGETDDQQIRALRRRQAKNMLVALMVARGTPMLNAGDELWLTKKGNNNTYSQDNELSWHDWRQDIERDEMLRFTRELVALRSRHPSLRRESFVDPFAIDGVVGQIGTSIRWHGVELDRPDWSFHSHSLALHVCGAPTITAPNSADDDIYVAFNAWTDTLAFALPTIADKRWYRLVDTFMAAPEDIVADEDKAVLITTERYVVSPRSSVILVAR